MAWFLSTNKPQPPAKPTLLAPPRDPFPPKEWKPNNTLWFIRISGGLTLALGVVVGGYFAEQALTDYSQARKSIVMKPDAVDLVSAPTWMSQGLKQHIRFVVASKAGDHPLDSAGLERAAEVLAKDAWVKEVRQIRRTPEGYVRVWAEYRQPIALVEKPDGCRPIDSQGTRLPGLYPMSEAITLGLPILKGVPTNAVSDGDIWPGSELHAAIALASTLYREPYYSQIKSIVIAPKDDRDRVRLSLETLNGTLNWGLAPGTEGTLEAAATTKKSRIAMIWNASHRSLDIAGRNVDINSAGVFVHLSPQEQATITPAINSTSPKAIQPAVRYTSGR